MQVQAKGGPVGWVGVLLVRWSQQSLRSTTGGVDAQQQA